MGRASRLKLVPPPQREVRIEVGYAEVEGAELVNYANQITSEEQWQELLGKADSDETREELNRVIGPLLPFRRAAPCHTPGCFGVAIWEPSFELHSRNQTDPIWAPLEVRYCEACKKEATLDALLPDSVWSQILEQMSEAGEERPVRWLTKLNWNRVH
jgi:hypothetical protein